MLITSSMNSYIKMVPALLLLIGVASCGQNNDRNYPENNNVTITNNNIQGFNISGLSDLVKKSTDPDALEKAINSPNNNINNLDLDEDGKVDFVKVQETGKNELKLVDDVSDTQSVTIATINITPDPNNNNTANMNIQGNPVYSGPNYYYHSSISFTDILIMSYLLRPHAYYMPMYHYGYYPRYYSTTRTTVTRPLYRPSTASYHSSPSGNRSSLSSPGRSQRSFSSSPSSSRGRSSGFGSSSQGSGRSGFGSSSSRSFGSGGGGRRSSGFGRRR